MPSQKTFDKMSEHRKNSKPIMEKRRRARINQYLAELKTLILEAMKKDPSRHSKLEKADILEMTVRHLQNMQRQKIASAISSDPAVWSKFRSGFCECANEVRKFLARMDGMDGGLKQRLLNYLNICMTSMNSIPTPTLSSSSSFLPTLAGLVPQFHPFAMQIAASLDGVDNISDSQAAEAGKMFGMALLQGRLSNDDDVSSYFPKRPEILPRSSVRIAGGGDLTFASSTSPTASVRSADSFGSPPFTLSTDSLSSPPLRADGFGCSSSSPSISFRSPVVPNASGFFDKEFSPNKSNSDQSPTTTTTSAFKFPSNTRQIRKPVAKHADPNHLAYIDKFYDSETTKDGNCSTSAAVSPPDTNHWSSQGRESSDNDADSSDEDSVWRPW